MARALTSPELALLRGDGQWTKLYLAVLQPNTIYTARLASLPSTNDNVHTISVGTESGTLSNVKPGMTAYVGSTAGAHDLGMVRIRKTPITGTWYIGLTSQVVWQPACYLTIVDDFDLWAKHAVIDSGALKMDVDVAYSDQHATFNPVPVLRGRNVVLWKTGSTVSFVGNAQDSWVPGSTISGHAWSAPGASATSGLTTATPTFTYNTTGNFRVYYTSTAANGKTTTVVMNVFVFDDDHMPATVFQLAQCVGDYETGGWMFDLTMEDEASLSEIRDRSLIVLFAKDWYGLPYDVAEQSIGPIEGRENIVCVGRIVGQSIRWDRESGQVHFTVQGLHHWLNKINAFPIQLTPKTVAANWSQMPLMTVDRVLWHILYWHSTAIETMDFYPTTDTRYTPEGMSMASSVWGQLADIAFSRIFASPGVDRFGRLFVEVDPQMVPEASRSSIPVVMALTDDDWQDGIDLQRVTVEDVSVIRLSSIVTNSSAGSITRYSLSPGHTPMRYGDPEMIDRVLAASQAQSNQLAGLVLGWRTNDLPDVPAVLLQNNRMFDLFPRQYASLEVAAGDTPRGVAYDVNLIPRRIRLLFDNESSSMHPEINFEGASSEQVSVNGDIPDVDDELTGPPFPPLPPLPPIDFIVPGTTEVTPEGPPKVLLHSATMGLLYSENFNEASPEWTTVNSGLTTAQYQSINVMFVCPNGALYVGYIVSADSGNYTSRQMFVARAPFIGGTFEVIISEPDIRPVGLAGNWGVFGLGYNPLVSEQVAYIAGVVSVDKKLYIGSGSSFAAGATIDGASLLWGTLTYGLGNWLYTRYSHFSRISPDGSTVVATGSPTIEGNTTDEGHVRASSTGITFHAKDFSNNIYKAEDNFASSTELGNGTDEIKIGFPESFAVDPSGTLVMARVGVGARGKSSDGATTFASMGALPFGNWWWAYAGGEGTDSRWVAAGGTAIRYSDDFGTSWVNKEGNLSYVDPVSQINMVRVISY